MNRSVADRPAGDQLVDGVGLRVVPVHERLGDVDVGRRRGGGDAVDLVQGQRQRLLAEHVLAGLGGPHRPLGVQVVRQRNVDRVDVRVGEQRLVAGDAARNPPLRRGRRRLVGVAAGDGLEACARPPPAAPG